MAALTEKQLVEFVTHCESSPDALEQQVASTITGAPVGTKAALGAGGGGLLGKLGPLWTTLGPLLLQLLAQWMAKQTPKPPA